MPIIKNAFPILEHDTEPRAVIDPFDYSNDGKTFPRRCVLTFFGEVLAEFVKKNDAVRLDVFKSEMREFPVYGFTYKSEEMCAMQATVGSGSIAMMVDWLIGRGVTELLVCGSCGVLTEIPRGEVLLPVRALRDEGASYHYLPPERTVSLDENIIAALKATLETARVPYREVFTWSTDAFYRETRDMVAYRKAEGCEVVEMECATIACVAKFRSVRFGQLLYGGDTLADADAYDDRDWYNDLSAREKLFYLCLECAVGL